MIMRPGRPRQPHLRLSHELWPTCVNHQRRTRSQHEYQRQRGSSDILGWEVGPRFTPHFVNIFGRRSRPQMSESAPERLSWLRGAGWLRRRKLMLDGRRKLLDQARLIGEWQLLRALQHLFEGHNFGRHAVISGVAKNVQRKA